MTESEPEALELMHRSARRTLESSVQAVESLDEKASKLLRINVLVLGVLASAARLGVRDAGTRPSVRWTFVLGLGAVALSTALAGWAYIGRDVTVGIGPVSGEAEDPITATSFHRAATQRLLDGAAGNRDHIKRSLRLFQAATVTLAAGVMFLAGSTATLIL